MHENETNHALLEYHFLTVLQPDITRTVANIQLKYTTETYGHTLGSRYID